MTMRMSRKPRRGEEEWERRGKVGKGGSVEKGGRGERERFGRKTRRSVGKEEKGEGSGGGQV